MTLIATMLTHIPLILALRQELLTPLARMPQSHVLEIRIVMTAIQ